ncbi:bifunctional serine/threonine protein kinase/MFS transporter [Streptomyces sp. NPDC050738]|uniref:bifunctional serine/threonine protein kinase/MFS transporter n=1 Tax=Streptomyces sp. NPDC050738 TaxID=3154744 RepID=UPI0034441B3B
MEHLTGQDPAHIGPYRLIARLGEGGMGLVYLGRSDLGRTVAVKVVQAEHAQHPEFRRRFTREVAAARRVGGDWTAAVLDADTEAAVPWVATQYIPGPDLTTVVGKDYGPLPEHSVHTLANRLALALQAVHEAGLIHRDLKPSNVLVTVDGPRVIDFGIARALDSIGGDSLLTRTGMLIGSPGFMSPEQVRGHQLTAANDLFCLGAVLVYAATGRLLFGATDTGLNAHLFRIAEEEADLTGVPDSLVDLVRACLSKDPALRPTTAQVVARTDTDRAEEWLPGSVLAQLGRKAAELLDFAPEQRGAPLEPTSYPLAPPAAASPAPPTYAPAAYSPTSPAHFGPAPGYTPMAPAPGGWPAQPYAAPGAGNGGGAPLKRGWSLAMATVAQLAVVLGATTSSVLLWDALRDFGSDSSSREWMVTAHFVAFGALLFLGGHLADVIGRKTTLLIGLSGFALATVVQASAAGPDMMLGGYIVQGAFAALVTPASFGLVAAHFTETRARAKAFGVYSLVGLGGSAVSLFLAVPLAQGVTWRVSLYVTVLLAVIALIGTAALVRDLSDRAPAGFDAAGALLSTLGVGAIVFALDRSSFIGWGAPLVSLCLTVGIILLTAFFWRQSHTDGAAILPPYDSGARARLGALIALFLTGAALYAVVPLLSSFLWSVGAGLGFLAFLAMTGSFLIGALLVSARLQYVAPRTLLIPGLLLAAVGVLLISTSMDSPTQAFPSMICLSIGLGMSGTVLYSAITEGIAPHDSGGRAALARTGQELGDSAGAVLFGGMVGMHAEGSQDPHFLYVSAAALAIAALIGGLMIKGPTRSALPAEPWSAPTLGR